MKIYTKTGDKGTTSLVGGTRVAKCCDRLESYGTIDELNSSLGVVVTYCTDDADREFLLRVQNELFVIGGNLATDTSTHKLSEGTTVKEEMVSRIEAEIDRLTQLVPEQRFFILPGGCRGAAFAHVARTICRRAERCILRLEQCDADVDALVMAYVNRLSDYLFVLARKLNADAKVEDIPFKI